MDLVCIDLPHELTRLNAARRNSLVQAQHLDIAFALAAASERTTLTARPQDERLVAFSSDQNFLYVRHDVVIQSALPNNQEHD